MLLVQTVGIGSASAADTGISTRLDYARSPQVLDCPDGAELQKAVSKRLGYSPFFPAARQILIVEISDVPTGLSGRVRLIDSDGIIRGARELTETRDNCDELVAALALAISITLDPSVGLNFPTAETAVDEGTQNPQESPEAPAADGHATDEATEGSLTPSSEAQPTPPAPAQARRVPPVAAPRSSTEFSLQGSALLAFGAAPSVVPGARVGGRVRLGSAQIELDLFGTLAGAQSSLLGGEVHAQQFGISLAPCWRVGWLLGCGIANLGLWHSEGAKVSGPRTENSALSAIGARVELDLPIVASWSLLLNADLLRTLAPITLRLHGADVWTSPSLSGTFGAGVSRHF